MTAENGAALLEVDDLSARYGAVQALDAVSLIVGDGQIVSLLGSNGAGKSTLLNAITGVVPKHRGRVRLAGHDVTKAKPWALVDQGLAHVPEGRQVFPHLSIEEHLRLARRAPRNGRDAFLAHDVFELFPRLAERARVAAGNLSGGEQQMLAIGRALVTQPIMLLLDEPSLGLSPKLAQTVIGAVATLRDRGVSVLLVEQNAALALDVSDQVYVLTNGRITARGSADHMRQSDEVRRAYLGDPSTAGSRGSTQRGTS
jgi:branched-chain amino acid transport system ATP-binding protein